MKLKSRIALGFLAMAVGIAPALAQGQQQGPPPPQQGQGPSGAPGNGGYMRPRGPIGPDGPGGPAAQRDQMDRRDFARSRMDREGFRGGPMGRRFGGRGRMGFGGRGMGYRGAGGFLNNPALRQRLGITADQTAKLHQQELEFQKSEIRNRADLQVKRLELNELLSANNPDRAAINAKLQEVSTAQMASEKAAIDNRLATRDILTPAQRQQLQQLRTSGFQQGDGAPQAPPRPGGRRGRGAAQRGGPAPAAPQGQAPPNQ